MAESVRRESPPWSDTVKKAVSECVQSVLIEGAKPTWVDVDVVRERVGKNGASIVPIRWLRDQLDECERHGQQAIRIAASPDGKIYIEGWRNPTGWANDWPKPELP